MLTKAVASDGKAIIDSVLKHDGLLSTIVQWGFWGEEHRPNLVQELRIGNWPQFYIREVEEPAIEICTDYIAACGKLLTKLLVVHIAEEGHYTDNDDLVYMKKDCLELMQIVGSTPIVSKTYDPSCMVSYMVGKLRQMKHYGIDKQDFKEIAYLINTPDCVDKDVIIEVIDFGMNHAKDYKSAKAISRLSAFMICRDMANEPVVEEIVNQPSDTKVAFAIRAGLIEMCLTIIKRSGVHETFGRDDDDSYDYLLEVFTSLHEISMNKKTWKAIRHKKDNVLLELKQLEQNTHIANNPKCKKLLDMIRFILSFHGSYCCRCNKSLSRTEVKQCSGCHCMAYCSEDCQREDWLNGHKLACCKVYTTEQLGTFQGRVLPRTKPEDERIVAKLGALEANLSMIELNLLLCNADKILSQARELDLPLHDCVVRFDLDACPAMVSTFDYNTYFEDPTAKKDFEESRSKGNITCIYLLYNYVGELDEDRCVQTFVVQRLFSHQLLSQKIQCREL